MLIEKPARGNFLPLLDGGYSLQYSPLLEYREGRGLMLLCQMDVTGRTEADPAADALVRNLFAYVADWQPTARRQAVYVGDTDDHRHLADAGVPLVPFGDGSLSSDRVLVVGRGGGSELSEHGTRLAEWLEDGGFVLGIGLDQADANAVLPLTVTLRRAEHISSWFAPAGWNSLLAGIGPADVHNRDPRDIPLLSDGARGLGNGVLALAEGANVVLCQLAPWEFDSAKPMNQKRTHRRVAFLLNRLLGNLGVAASTPLLDRFHRPVEDNPPEKRWLDGFYLDQPEEWDDPYRFFRW